MGYNKQILFIRSSEADANEGHLVAMVILFSISTRFEQQNKTNKNEMIFFFWFVISSRYKRHVPDAFVVILQ